MGLEMNLSGEETKDEIAWALIDFASLCLENHGNLTITISGKFAAVQYFRRVHRQVDLVTESSVIKVCVDWNCEVTCDSGKTTSSSFAGDVEHIACGREFDPKVGC